MTPSITFLPSWMDNLASPRIRVYTLMRSLLKKGVRATFQWRGKTEVAVIPNTVSAETLGQALDAKRRGTIIIYDTDEDSAAFRRVDHPALLQMLQTTDLVTTNTEGCRRKLLRDLRCNNVAIVPDAIDYYPDRPGKPTVRDRPFLRVLWFGNAANFEAVAPYMDLLTSLPGIRMIVVTDGLAVNFLRRAFPRVEFHPWSLNDFVGHLQSCDLACLVHSRSEGAPCQSNNRMITSIHWGVPAIVSDSVEYARTARECGVGGVIFSDGQSLRTAIERFRSAEARRQYLQRAQPAVWKHYAPDVVADFFLKTVDGLLASRNCRKHQPLVLTNDAPLR